MRLGGGAAQAHGEARPGLEQHVQRPCAAGGMRMGEAGGGQLGQSLRGPGFPSHRLQGVSKVLTNTRAFIFLRREVLGIH